MRQKLFGLARARDEDFVLTLVKCGRISFNPPVVLACDQLGRLHPTPHRSFIVRILRTKSPLQVTLFSRYDDMMHEHYRDSQRGQ